MMYLGIVLVVGVVAAMVLMIAAAAGLCVATEQLRRYLIRDKVKWGIVPVPSDMFGVEGCFVGACGVTGEMTFRSRVMAHAHVSGPLTGWVCFREREFIEKKRVRRHELAHIISSQADHNDEWRKSMSELGRRIPRQYRKSHCK